MVTRARDPGPLAREIAHTADTGFEVEAPTLAALFERAGLALLSVVADLASVESRERRTIAVQADGLVELLHDWLHELLVSFQPGGFLVAEIAVDEIAEHAVRGTLMGEPIDRARHTIHTEVKGITYHQLAVEPHAAAWRARVILDL